jgi:hypothetical protein
VIILKVTNEQLRKLLATYKLKASRIEPVEQGYLAETTKGTKLISVWDNADLLRWSNSWREELFKLGHQEVERFLVNGNKKRYIRYQGKYFVVSDVPRGNPPDPYQKEDCLLAGEAYGKIHLAVTQIKSKLQVVSHSPIEEQLFSEGMERIKEQFHMIEEKEAPELLDEVMYLNIPLLYQRLGRAHQLWQRVSHSVADFPLSSAGFQFSQLIKFTNGCYVRGGYNVPLCRLHEDTAQAIREIYEHSGWSSQAIADFLEGYEKHRKLSDEELVYLLIHFTVPWDVWNHFSDYVKQSNLSEEQAEDLMESIRRQRYWDDVTIQIAKYIDVKKKLSA